MTFQKHRINRRVIQDLKKRSSIGILFYLLVPYILLFTDNYFHRHPDFSTFFLSAQTFICAFRFTHLFVAKKMSTKYEHVNNNIFITSVVLTALAWGAGEAYFLFQEGEPKAQLLMTISTVGFCAGGVVSFLPERRLAIAYNFLMFLPGSVAIFVRGDHFTLGIFILFYSLYLVMITLRGSNEYWRALENEFLLEKKSRELKQASRIDALTGLYNRRHFDELFHLAWGMCARRGTPITLAMADIDHFKKINDSSGHLAGDAYLKFISQCLQDIFQRETDIIARYGGEEFIIAFPDKNTETVHSLVEEFRKRVERTILDYKGMKISATISLGMTCCIPRADQGPETLIAQADSILYKAKNTGRNKLLIGGEEKVVAPREVCIG